MKVRQMHLKITDISLGNSGSLYIEVNGYSVNVFDYNCSEGALMHWLKAISELPEKKYKVSFAIHIQSDVDAEGNIYPHVYPGETEILLGKPYVVGARSGLEAHRFLLNQLYHEIGHVLFGDSEKKAQHYADEHAGPDRTEFIYSDF